MDRPAAGAQAGARGAGTGTPAAGGRLRNSRGCAAIPERSRRVSVRYIHGQTLLAACQPTAPTRGPEPPAATCQVDSVDTRVSHPPSLWAETAANLLAASPRPSRGHRRLDHGLSMADHDAVTNLNLSYILLLDTSSSQMQGAPRRPDQRPVAEVRRGGRTTFPTFAARLFPRSPPHFSHVLHTRRRTLAAGSRPRSGCARCLVARRRLAAKH